jgi:hypothetical protein
MNIDFILSTLELTMQQIIDGDILIIPMEKEWNSVTNKNILFWFPVQVIHDKTNKNIPSMLINSYSVKQYGTMKAIELYKNQINKDPELLWELLNVAGKKIYCDCTNKICVYEFIWNQIITSFAMEEDKTYDMCYQYYTFKDEKIYNVFGKSDKVKDMIESFYRTTPKQTITKIKNKELHGYTCFFLSHNSLFSHQQLNWIQNR